MPVYFIRAGKDGPVKIGVAADIPERIKALQTAHFEELALIREIPGDFEDEVWLHARFADQAIRGEWFQFSAEMLTVEPPAEEPINTEDFSRERTIREMAEMVRLAAAPFDANERTVVQISRAAERTGLPRNRIKKFWYRNAPHVLCHDFMRVLVTLEALENWDAAELQNRTPTREGRPRRGGGKV